MNYVYTVDKVVAHIEPYNPFYEICNYAHCSYFFVIDPVPRILTNSDDILKYSLEEGYFLYNKTDIDDDLRDRIIRTQQILKIHKIWLNLANSCKMKYMQPGLGNETFHRLLQDEVSKPNEVPKLFFQLAISKETDVDSEIERWKLFQEDLKNIFMHLIAIEQRMLALIKQEKYNEAIEMLIEQRKILRY